MPGVGVPEAVTVELKAVPPGTTSVAPLVMCGAIGVRTVRVKAWLASGLTPLCAVTVNGYTPGATAVVPASVAVPSPLSVKVTPAGRADGGDALNAGLSMPVAVIVSVNAEPASTVSLAALVICGAVGKPITAVSMSVGVAVHETLPERGRIAPTIWNEKVMVAPC